MLNKKVKSEYYKDTLYFDAPDNDYLIWKLESAGVDTRYIGSRAMLISLWEDIYHMKKHHYIGTSFHWRDNLHRKRNRAWDSDKPTYIPPFPYNSDGEPTKPYEVRSTSDRNDYGSDSEYSNEFTEYDTNSISYMEQYAKGSGNDTEFNVNVYKPKAVKANTNNIGGAFSLPYEEDKRANDLVKLNEKYANFKYVPGEHSESAQRARDKNRKAKRFESLCESYAKELESTPNLLHILHTLYYSWSDKFKYHGFDLEECAQILVNYYAKGVRPRKKKLKFLKHWEKKWAQYIMEGFM